MGFTSRNAEKLSMLRVQRLTGRIVMAASSPTSDAGLVAPCSGEIVDVVANQIVAGGGGTSIALTIQKQPANVAALATGAVIARTDGAYAAVDLRGRIAKPAGATRPVVSATRANRRVNKGDLLVATLTPTGTYSATFPTWGFEIHIAPDA